MTQKVKKKGDVVNTNFREMKVKLKQETDMQRKLMGDIKLKHSEIINLEKRQKEIQNAIKT